MRSSDTYQIIRETGIIAILRGTGEDESLHTIDALVKGGVKAIEVTFNTPNADSIIKRAVKEFGGSAIIGAGTVTNTSSAVRAIECGAQFVLAPNTDADVISIVRRYGKLMIPGAFTATEVLKCYESGADVVKIFPVTSVGPKYIKDLRGPYDYVDMIPVGGVDIDNAEAFIKAGSVALGVGGGLIKKEFIANRDYKSMEELAARFISKVNDNK